MKKRRESWGKLRAHLKAFDHTCRSAVKENLEMKEHHKNSKWAQILHDFFTADFLLPCDLITTVK